MFSFLRAKQNISVDVVSGFGKLPIYAEFIKYKMNDLRLHAFDEWCQGAHEVFNKKSEVKLGEIPNYYFLLNDVNLEFSPIVGLMRVSQDLSGRISPFIICRFLNHLIAKEHFSAVPLLYQDYFQTANDLFLRASDYNDLNSFLGELNKLAEKNKDFHKLNVLEKTLADLKSVSINDFFQTIISEDFFGDWYEQLRLLKELFDKGKVRAVRLLIPKIKKDISLVFILQILEELIGLRQRSWQVFWEIESHSFSQVLIVFGKLQVEDWFMLLDENTVISPDVFDFLTWQRDRLSREKGLAKNSSSVSLGEAINIVRRCLISL